ncbi:OLC1v1006589C1 [Oldenlandia corymbosa var. corymbosa]|uniref:OLC1v1006589C1 n=1 Tax=Oldenlandia corymbosa var. corymbosa TaxID=529605 RepID=A0AAV1DJL0_OLDCO|nr:OLC1v1006589C1 [Oldenlandia corymbosa var. corymbosa]
MDGRRTSEAFEIVNVIWKRERRVGFWTSKHGIVKGRSLSGSSSSTSQRVGLEEAIVWPGFTTIAPRELLMIESQHKLKIAVLNNAGFKQFISVERDNYTNTTSITGFCVDVFHAVIDQTGKNLGSYSELVYQLYLENFDGIVGDVTITSNRSLYADFTITYSDIGMGTITKRESNNIWLFSRPLQPDLWVAIVGFLVLNGLVRYIVDNTNVKDDRLQFYSSPEGYADAVSKGIKNGGVIAIKDEIPYLKVFLAKYGDGYSMVASRSTTNAFGFVSAFNLCLSSYRIIFYLN